VDEERKQNFSRSCLKFSTYNLNPRETTPQTHKFGGKRDSGRKQLFETTKNKFWGIALTCRSSCIHTFVEGMRLLFIIKFMTTKEFLLEISFYVFNSAYKTALADLLCQAVPLIVLLFYIVLEEKQKVFLVRLCNE
jgi:hypothetical protein